MATSGKKNKKVKRKAVSLHNFLAENGVETKQGVVLVTKPIAPSWVEEIDDDDEYDRPLQTFSLPTAPRASRAMDDVPEVGPFIAHLSNLPFDIEDEDLYEFFAEMEVDSLRLPREDGSSGRSRGFGYIEFKRRNDLIAALSMPDPHIRNRRIRIDISTEADQKRGGRGRYDGFGDTNWRKEGGGNRDDEDGGGRQRSYGGFGGGGGTWDRTNTASADEGGNWRSSMKQKSDSPPPMRRNYGGDRDGGDRGRDRYMGRGSGGRNDERPRAAEEVEAERPKLNLQKRTLPLPEIVAPPAEELKEAEPVRPEPTPVPAAQIFGDAKPVDTSAREREVEERLERERQAREQAAEDARKERAAAAEAAKVAADAAAAEEKHAVVEGDAETKVEAAAPVVNSWRRKTDETPSNGNVDAPRSQSPARRRYSPDRRGGHRRNDDRRGNDRDFHRRDDNRRDDIRRDDNRRDDNRRDGHRSGENRDHRGRNDNVTRGRGGDDKPMRRNDNRFESSGDENAPPKEAAEPRMPKYQAPTNAKLQTTNKFEFLDDEGSD